jgi:hypothetical protein
MLDHRVEHTKITVEFRTFVISDHEENCLLTNVR